MANTIKLQKNNTKIIAHRGLSGIECENTNAAFIAAANRSYFGIETDIHVSSDGHIIVIHDERTGRVSDVDIDVEESTFEEIKKVMLNGRDGLKRRDLVIPTLEEYISICKCYKKTAVIEIKNKFEDEMIKKTIDEIKKTGYLENVIFISFVFENLVKIREILPSQQVQFLTDKCDDALIAKLSNHKMDIDIVCHALCAELADKLHRNGIKINCWTCDDKDEAEKLMGYGVDYITSDILE